MSSLKWICMDVGYYVEGQNGSCCWWWNVWIVNLRRESVWLSNTMYDVDGCVEKWGGRAVMFELVCVCVCACVFLRSFVFVWVFFGWGIGSVGFTQCDYYYKWLLE